MGEKGEKWVKKRRKAPPLYEPEFLGAHPRLKTQHSRLRYAMKCYAEREGGRGKPIDYLSVGTARVIGEAVLEPVR